MHIPHQHVPKPPFLYALLLSARWTPSGPLAFPPSLALYYTHQPGFLALSFVSGRCTFFSSSLSQRKAQVLTAKARKNRSAVPAATQKAWEPTPSVEQKGQVSQSRSFRADKKARVIGVGGGHVDCGVRVENSKAEGEEGRLRPHNGGVVLKPG